MNSVLRKDAEVERSGGSEVFIYNLGSLEVLMRRLKSFIEYVCVCVCV